MCVAPTRGTWRWCRGPETSLELRSWKSRQAQRAGFNSAGADSGWERHQDLTDKQPNTNASERRALSDSRPIHGSHPTSRMGVGPPRTNALTSTAFRSRSHQGATVPTVLSESAARTRGPAERHRGRTPAPSGPIAHIESTPTSPNLAAGWIIVSPSRRGRPSNRASTGIPSPCASLIWCAQRPWVFHPPTRCKPSFSPVTVLPCSLCQHEGRRARPGDRDRP